MNDDDWSADDDVTAEGYADQLRQRLAALPTECCCDPDIQRIMRPGWHAVVCPKFVRQAKSSKVLEYEARASLVSVVTLTQDELTALLDVVVAAQAVEIEQCGDVRATGETMGRLSRALAAVEKS